MSAPRPPAFFAKPGRRLYWLHQLHAAGLDARIMRTSPHRKGCFVINVAVMVPGMGKVRVSLIFPLDRPEAVAVYAAGPNHSPHRYRDGALCMWFPRDDASRRWTADDGPVNLLGHAIAHLAREEWWRRTGEWVGDEVPHGEVSSSRNVMP